MKKYTLKNRKRLLSVSYIFFSSLYMNSLIYLYKLKLQNISSFKFIDRTKKKSYMIQSMKTLTNKNNS
jgi:hypothetical protein